MSKRDRTKYNKEYYNAHRGELAEKRRARAATRRETQRNYDRERFEYNVPVRLWVPRDDYEEMRARGGTIADLIRTYIVWGLENSETRN